MAKFMTQIRFIAGALALAFVIAVAAPASAQQPSSVNPTASAVKEQQLLQELNRIQGRVSIPDKRSDVLEQPAGREWRQWHQVTLRWIGAIAILGVLGLLVAFYLVRGQVKLESGFSGRKIVRFNGIERFVHGIERFVHGIERFVHWLTATCFIILAISGLNVTFGKALLLPLIGPSAFSTWSELAKYSHNFLSFPFTIGVVLIFLMWIGSNIPNKIDVEWVKRGGGIIGKDHPPADHFNAGQKMIYWVVVLGGGASAVTGYLLLFPFYGTEISGMQLAQIVHSAVAMLFIAAMLGHIYIGTIGMEGAFKAMGEGTVDVNWAKEHHSIWLEEEKARVSAKDAQRPTMRPGPRSRLIV